MNQIKVKDARICKKNAWICVGCGVGEFGCFGTYDELPMADFCRRGSFGREFAVRESWVRGVSTVDGRAEDPLTAATLRPIGLIATADGRFPAPCKPH
jgi:hypothetical protein